MIKDVIASAVNQNLDEGRVVAMLTSSLFSILVSITCVVLAILTMTESVSLTAGSSVLLSGSAFMLLLGGSVAYNASKDSNLSWKKVAAYTIYIFLSFAPTVMCGGLTLGGVLNSPYLMGGLCLGLGVFHNLVLMIDQKCQNQSTEEE